MLESHQFAYTRDCREDMCLKHTLRTKNSAHRFSPVSEFASFLPYLNSRHLPHYSILFMDQHASDRLSRGFLYVNRLTLYVIKYATRFAKMGTRTE